MSLSVGDSLSGTGNMINLSGGSGATTGGNVLVSSGMLIFYSCTQLSLCLFNNCL